MDFPNRMQYTSEITQENLFQLLPALTGSAATDVTGGMRSKVMQSLDLVKNIPGLEILIFSGLVDGNVSQALVGYNPGTLIYYK